MNIGAEYLGEGKCKFTVWSPISNKVALHLISPKNLLLPMEQQEYGYFTITVNDVYPGTNYFFQLNEKESFPDPASHFQVKDVHGPSVVIDHSSFQWKDNNWKGFDFKDAIIYELHVGTFTSEGTFNSMISKLDYLVELGVNTIEIMPISQFSGNRNWGYDGVYIYSIHNTYGSPDDFKRLVDECHGRGIAVILDVVYNHMGPEGNYLTQYAPYFTNKYCTPWGDALNFDDEYSDGVRDFFSDNALFWLEEYHLDGLRLDATHMVFDNGCIHFWQYMSEKVKQRSIELDRKFHLIAESDLNGLKPIQPIEQGGYNFRAQWLDDFHHALYVLLDKKGKQYYADFGELAQLKKALKDGFVHSGDYVEFRKRKHGCSSAGVDGDTFIAFLQNHDQIGNRMLGERNTVLMPLDALKLGAAVVILSPYIPMIFMGEEYAEENPFLYFISHLDDHLVELVRKGRTKDFEKYNFEGTPPDPQAEETFNRSKLQWQLKDHGKHKVMLEWYKELIRVRKSFKSFSNFDKNSVSVDIIGENVISLVRNCDNERIKIFFNLSDENTWQSKAEVEGWEKVLDSSEDKGGEKKNDVEQRQDQHKLAPWNVQVFFKRN